MASDRALRDVQPVGGEMTPGYFDTLTLRDFENGAIRDAIRKDLRRLSVAESDYHRVMALLKSTTLPHGKCQPRSDRACTKCNAQEELDAIAAVYKGAPIKAA